MDKVKDFVLAGDLKSQTGRTNMKEASSTCHFYLKKKKRESSTIERYVSHNGKSAIDPIFNNMKRTCFDYQETLLEVNTDRSINTIFKEMAA